MIFRAIYVMTIFASGSPYPWATDDFPSHMVCMREGERLLDNDHRIVGFTCGAQTFAQKSSP